MYKTGLPCTHTRYDTLLSNLYSCFYIYIYILYISTHTASNALQSDDYRGNRKHYFIASMLHLRKEQDA